MKKLLALMSVVAVLAIVLERPAQAQFGASGSGGTSSGLFGSRSQGSGISSGRTSSGATGGDSENAGAVTGSERYVRGNRDAGTFVGADTSDTTAIGGTQQNAGGGRNAMQSMFGGQGGFAQFARDAGFNPDQGGGGNASRTQLRIPIKLGFKPAPTDMAVVQTTFQSRLGKLPGLKRLGPISVEMQGNTAILRGVVASEEDRLLAEELALMEPAIADVNNELIVGPVAPMGEELPVPIPNDDPLLKN